MKSCFPLPLQDDGILRLTVKQLTEHRGYENITNKVLKQHLGPAKVKELQGNPKGHGLAKQEAAKVLRTNQILYAEGMYIPLELVCR